MIEFLRKLFKNNASTKKVVEHQEKDTRCDKCAYKDECSLLEITISHDTRRHYIPAVGNECRMQTKRYD